MWKRCCFLALWVEPSLKASSCRSSGWTNRMTACVCAAFSDRPGKASQIVRSHWGQAALPLRGLNVFTPTHSLQLCRNLSMSLQAGNSLLIVGPSGCGKSSLLRAIAGWCLLTLHQAHYCMLRAIAHWYLVTVYQVLRCSAG